MRLWSRRVVAMDQNGMTMRAVICLRQGRCCAPEFIFTALLLDLTPGPNMAYLATLTLDRGRRAGLPATVGVAAGLSVHAMVAAWLAWSTRRM
jgi:hypothetical protein